MPKTLPKQTSFIFTDPLSGESEIQEKEDKALLKDLLNDMQPVLEKASSDLIAPRKEAIDGLLKKLTAIRPK